MAGMLAAPAGNARGKSEPPKPEPALGFWRSPESPNLPSEKAISCLRAAFPPGSGFSADISPTPTSSPRKGRVPATRSESRSLPVPPQSRRLRRHLHGGLPALPPRASLDEARKTLLPSRPEWGFAPPTWGRRQGGASFSFQFRPDPASSWSCRNPFRRKTHPAGPGKRELLPTRGRAWRRTAA